MFAAISREKKEFWKIESDLEDLKDSKEYKF